MAIDIEKVKGIIVPIIIPVDKEENIDEVKLRFMVNHVIDNGVHGILAFGSNSEFYMFDEDEMIDGLKIILDEAKNACLCISALGRSGQGIASAWRSMLPLWTSMAFRCCTDVIVQTEDSLYDHFKAIADAVPELPFRFTITLA